MLSFYLSPEFAYSNLCQILKTFDLSCIHSHIYNWSFLSLKHLNPDAVQHFDSNLMHKPKILGKVYLFTYCSLSCGLSGKEETKEINCLLCRKTDSRPIYLQNSKFSADAFMWWGVSKYYRTWRPSLGKGYFSRALTFLTISYS